MTFYNIGIKFDLNARNLYLNEFMYGILANIYNF